MTTRAEISEWFDRGVKDKSTYMIVVCDTYDHDDYPAYVGQGEDFYAVYDRYDGQNMQRIMEVYDLTADKDEQMRAGRTHRVPPRAAQRRGVGRG